MQQVRGGCHLEEGAALPAWYGAGWRTRPDQASARVFPLHSTGVGSWMTQRCSLARLPAPWSPSAPLLYSRCQNMLVICLQAAFLPNCPRAGLQASMWDNGRFGWYFAEAEVGSLPS